MKIGVLIDRLNIGGVEKIAIEEVRALREEHIEAYLVILSRKAVVENPFPDLIRDIPIIYLEDNLPFFLRFNIRIPFFYFFSLFHLTYPLLLPFFVKKHAFTKLISHNSYTSFTAFTLFKFRDIPYSIYIWDPIAYILEKAYQTGPIFVLSFLLIPLAKFIDRLLIKNAEKVFVSGKLHATYIEKMGGKRKIIYLPPGHNCIRQLPKLRGDEIITVTAWKEGKGLEELLKIIALFSRAKLVVGGKWIHIRYRDKIEQLIYNLKLAERVRILGEVPEDKLNKLYASARMTVIVNNERGFGMAALEAASNGCPFIIPKDTGAARYFIDTKDGFYFTYGDTKALKNYIEKLLNNERLAYTMGKHGWEAVRDKYSWKQHVKMLV